MVIDNAETEIDTFIRELIRSKSLDRTKAIEVLQQVQRKFGYISREAIPSISRHLGISEVEVWGVATFYEQFRFNRPGKHTIKVCEGTACHVKGGATIGQIIEHELKIGHGETTEDGLFSLERVACLGCCALAPVIVIDENIHGQMDSPRLSKLLNEYKEKEGVE